MELRRISDQSNESLIGYFEKFCCSTHASHRELGVKMVALIRHLEETVDAPVQWATTSHFWFYFGSVDHWDPQKARIFVHANAEGFEIKYRTTEEFSDWTNSFTCIKAANINEATDAVRLALEKAAANPIGRFCP